MMASLVLNSIRSALNALEGPGYIPKDRRDEMKCKLKHLELFVLCARKLGNHGKVRTLSSLFQRIHHALPATSYNWDLDTFDNFESAVANLKKQIGGWYKTLLVSLTQLTFDEVTDIIDSVWEILHLILNLLFYRRQRSIQPIETLIGKMRFLRNFIRFATLRSVEPPQLFDNLLAHIHAVALHAAHTSFMYSFQLEAGEPNIPEPLQMIGKANSQVDETYTQALTSSKLSTHLLSPIIMKDFIDSLLWNLWERLHPDTPIVISTNSKLQLVYEGLRLLRCMLKKQPHKFDEIIGELTRVVICDAGILIFSLYPDFSISDLLQRISDIRQRVEEKDLSITDLLQRISDIRQRVEGKDLSVPDLQQWIHRAREQVGGNDLPKTNELGFIDFVLENLLGMTSSKKCYDFQSQFRMTHDELSSLRSSLGKIEGVRNEQKDLEALRNDFVEVAYRVEFFIDLVLGDFQGSSSTSFDFTGKDIKRVNSMILREVESIKSKIHPAPDIEAMEGSVTPNPVTSLNRAPVTDEIVGFHDDTTSIVDRLTRGSVKLKIVAIVGMPGMGKTTLATKVFNDPRVTCYFHVRLQCCVSQSFHRKKLLLELLNLVDAKTNIEMSEQDLSEKLWRHLIGKKYLIFLDDVWDIEAWDSLKELFPDESYGSRILMTSRQHRDVVPQAMLDVEALSPSKLTEDQSWELIQKKLPRRNERSLELDELGKQIAANCKGLPLTVVIVAGLLANTEPEGWKIFLESISSVSGANHCMDTLELSYKHLPSHLKQCFLYFGSFPEDHEVPVRRLIQLWIAEGFVLRSESKSIEDVARDYMMELVRRSLLMVSKERSRGGVKACRIHDLLHNFCRTKAKEENFLQILEGGYDEYISFKEPGYIRRLCVRSDKKHFKNLRLFWPRLHSLLFFAQDKEELDRDISFIIRRYRRLRVLDISQYSLSWTFGIPSEIECVLELKYLSVTGYIRNIPLSIGCLTNLETFILHSHCGGVLMPDTFWNLQKLRHVDIKEGFRLAFEGLEKYPELFELQSCSNVVLNFDYGESIERLVRKFPNIRKFGCYFYSEDSKILIPNSPQLESLHLTSGIHSRELSQTNPRFEFDFPGNLTKLSLTMFELHQSDVSRIGKLPHLQVLKFRQVDFHGNTWDMVEGEFSKLKYLELVSTKIVRWTVPDHQFSYLEKLVLRECHHLTEISCWFEIINTLKMVQVFACSDSVNRFFKRIQGEQMESGYLLPKIQIS